MANVEYKNRAELGIIACGEHHTIYSNEVVAKKVVVRIEKFQDRCCVFSGDYIEYTIKIYNDSCFSVECPLFNDFLPEGITYTINTFSVDNIPETPAQDVFSNSLSYNLGTLSANSMTEIKFKALVS